MTGLDIADKLRDPTEQDLVQSLLEMNNEAMVITVDEGKIAVFHKFKGSGGVLNNYLVGLLQELISRTQLPASEQKSAGSNAQSSHRNARRP